MTDLWPAGIVLRRGAEQIEEALVFQESGGGDGENALGLGGASQQLRGIGQERAVDETHQDLAASMIELADAALDRPIRVDNVRYFSHFQKRQFSDKEWFCLQQQP